MTSRTSGYVSANAPSLAGACSTTSSAAAGARSTTMCVSGRMPSWRPSRTRTVGSASGSGVSIVNSMPAPAARALFERPIVTLWSPSWRTIVVDSGIQTNRAPSMSRATASFSTAIVIVILGRPASSAPAYSNTSAPSFCSTMAVPSGVRSTDWLGVSSLNGGRRPCAAFSPAAHSISTTARRGWTSAFGVRTSASRCLSAASRSGPRIRSVSRW